VTDRSFVHPVRRAVAEDVPAIGRMLHDLNREFGEPAAAPEVLAERVLELQSRRNFVVLLAGTGPDGLAVLRFRPSIWTAAQECYLAELYRAPSGSTSPARRTTSPLARCTRASASRTAQARSTGPSATCTSGCSEPCSESSASTPSSHASARGKRTTPKRVRAAMPCTPPVISR
jgi:hypothetical protein